MATTSVLSSVVGAATADNARDRGLGQDSPSPAANNAQRQPQPPESLLSDEVVTVFPLACISGQ
jgi:hypothetical protein